MDAEKDPEALNQANLLAKKILMFSRDTLLVNLRFLDASIHQLKLQQHNEIATLATDGEHLFYAPWYILNAYKQNQETITRDYLHVIFHCLFQHLFINKKIHQGCWDLACDIAVESAINDLELPSFENSRKSNQDKFIAKLKETLKIVTAEKIYRYYLDLNLSDHELASIRKDFCSDDHSLWYLPPQDGKNDGYESNSLEEFKNTDKDNANEAQIYTRTELISVWKQISERAQVDIETTTQKWGDRSGGLHQELRKLNREKYDYHDFLKRFSVLGEAMQINDDEFDLIFYTYGLELYGNVPLIEPLEYKEVKRIKEFVIAIDTSGSVSGKIVQAFLQKTYNILMQAESFFTKVNIHIIQCDAEIQEDTKITNIEEFHDYIRTMKLKGFGGTDFRPVFTYVDKLIKHREFENLKGLIYFTDGYGYFPAKKPSYDIAFVFLEDDFFEIPKVPAWAIKLVLTSEELMERGEI